MIEWTALTVLALASSLPLVTRSAGSGPARRLTLATGVVGASALALAAHWLIAGRPQLTFRIGGALLGDLAPWLPSLRIDGLSIVMVLLVAGLGHVVARYSERYLQGDPERAGFARALGATLAGIMLFVVAGDLLTLLLGWLALGGGLGKLLVHRRERPGAWQAARARRRSARFATVALLAAIAIAALAAGSLDPHLIAASPVASGPAGLLIGLALTIAALAMSVQPPFHGWLIDSMETPTPVSALMHAGIVNAGGTLLIRSAPIFEAAPAALWIPLGLGSATAAFASLVMLTQTDIKRKLACSTVGQMGFMLMQCGLGAFTAATLHLVAHAIYKAYAFLASGAHVASASEVKAAPLRRPGVAISATCLGLGAAAVAVAASITGIGPAAKAGGWVIAGVLAIGVAQALLLEWTRRPAGGPGLAILAIGVALPTTYFLLWSGLDAVLGLEGFDASGQGLQATVLLFFLAAAGTQLAAWARPEWPAVQRAYSVLRAAPGRSLSRGA